MTSHSNTANESHKAHHPLNRTLPSHISKAALVLLVFIGLGAILLLLSFVQEPQDPQSQASEHPERFVKNEKKGLIWDDLKEPTSDDSPCKSRDKDKKKDLLEMVDKKSGKALGCTHGPDPAPEGLDVRQSVEPVRTGEDDKTAAAIPGVAYAQLTSNTGLIPCEGDGVSGKRVQFIYVHASDKPDRYSAFNKSFQVWAANTDVAFSESAAQTNGVRHLRIVTDANCQAVIPDVVVSAAGDDSISATMSELQTLGYNRTDRKYMLFVDAGIYCGIGSIKGDDQAGSGNVNNSGPSYARVDSGCWGRVDSAEAHELMHNLGGVQLSAPHTTGGWHCTDESDRECYSDASGVVMTNPCTSFIEEAHFDCNKDDYFYAGTPPAGNYLSNHWNTANSLFLTNTENLVALPDHPIDCTPGPNVAIIYSLENFGGICKPLVLGYAYPTSAYLAPVNSDSPATQTSPQTSTRPNSARVGENVKLTLCYYSNWSNGCDTYAADAPTLVHPFSAVSALVESRSGSPVPTVIPPSPTPTIIVPTPTQPTGDTILPVVTISSPLSGAIIGNSVTVSATATDNVGVTKMEIFIDNQLKKTSSTGSVSYSWNSRKASKGSHTITVKAYDARGNVGSSTIGVIK